MERVFGLPIGGLTVALAATMAAATAVIGLLAVRHRVFFRMGVRNIRRRPARSSLIVAGLMLGTAIICSALTTGDTMSRTVRRSVIETLGGTDERVTVKGAVSTGQAANAGTASSAGGTGVRWFSEDAAIAVAGAARASGSVDGVGAAIVETLAAQDQTSQQNEPRVTIFAPEPSVAAGLAPMKTTSGAAISLAQLAPGEVFLNVDGASALHATAGHRLVLLAGDRAIPVTVKQVVKVDGAGTTGAAVVMPLAQAQAALGRPGQVTDLLVSNTGGSESGVRLTDRVEAALAPVAGPLGLEVSPVKRDGLDLADAQGNAFVTMFTTFGSFSMAAGILLIFLVFVMLAAERRGEMGMARAVGTQRRHLIETFLFEGAVYDVAAAAVGALLGVGVAYGMVAVMARAFAGQDFTFTFGVQPRSVVVAYGIGVLLTLGVVTASAWKVSRLNIVSAIRDIPEEQLGSRPRRRWLRAGAGVVVGAAIAAGGASAGQAMPFNLGVSIVIASLVLVATALGATPRAAYTVAGLTMVAWWLQPPELIPYVRDLSMDMSIWIVGGLAIVIGATWAVMYNADLLLGATMRVFGRIRSLAPVLKMAMAYPLRSRFRTAVTMSMFMLVVFTMVTGSVMPGSIMAAIDDKASFGGGFDIRATTSAAGSIGDMGAAMANTPGVNPRDYTAVASQSVVPAKMAQNSSTGTAGTLADYAVRGVDDAFLSHTTYGFGAVAKGYRTGSDVWAALAKDPSLAVVDAAVAPRRDQFGVGFVPPDFALHGFYVENGVFDAVPVTVQDPATGTALQVKVIGVLSDATPYELTAGLWMSQRALAPFGPRAVPTIHYFAVAPGVNAGAAATRLERVFLANGMQAETIEKILSRSVGGSRTFLRLIQGFMGLGLLVGVAALGVISARSVVERRQQLGVLRAIGFQPAMIRRTLLLESSFVAVTATVIGTALGLAMSYNVIGNMAKQPGWHDLVVTVPWATLGIVFGIVFLAALATTWLPAMRASRLYPAEALRYA